MRRREAKLISSAASSREKESTLAFHVSIVLVILIRNSLFTSCAYP